MSFKLFNIGLDFGTFQTKACVYYASEDPVKHEFFNFEGPKGRSFFFPSRVELLPNDRFTYGFQSNSIIKKEYLFFKMSSALDDEFRIISDYTNKDLDYEIAVVSGDFTPEFISVIYITYVLFLIKKKYTEKSQTIAGGGSILKRLFTRKSEDEIKFTIQLGIPTEYSEKVNLQRRRKFENILLISEILQKKTENLESYMSLPSQTLIKLVNEILSEIKIHKSSFFNLLNEYGISVFPETAAGLTYLIKTRQLENGCYSALDIGCGTSDLSFFRVVKEEIYYLASESFMIAANNIFQRYLNKSDITFDEIKTSENKIQRVIQNKTYLTDESYIRASTQVHKKLNEKVYKLFNGRVYYMFPRTKATASYNEQPCFVYGGGSKLPVDPRLNRILIHDSGNRSTIDSDMLTYASKEPIDKYLPNVDILPKDGSWKKDFSLLVVAFGLSFIHHEKDYLWNMIDYRDKTQDSLYKCLVPHPFNEDMYIYNVLARQWG